MQTGWKVVKKISWHFYTNSGAVKTGWLKDKGIMVLFGSETGIMAVGSKD